MTLATDVLLLAHVTVRPDNGAPFASFGVAVSCTVPLTWTEAAAGATLTEATGVGHVTVREGWPPINVFASSEWTAYRHNAPTAPEVTVRLGVTVAFPEWRAW